MKNAHFLRAIAMMYTTVSLLMIPLGFVFIARAILTAFKGLRRAVCHYEKIYWRLTIAAHLIFAYALFVLTAMAIDSLLGEPWSLLERWPSLTKSWNTTSNPAVSVLLDALTVLLGAFCVMCTALWFGHVDDNDVWAPPVRLARKAQEGNTAQAKRKLRLGRVRRGNGAEMGRRFHRY